MEEWDLKTSDAHYTCGSVGEILKGFGQDFPALVDYLQDNVDDIIQKVEELDFYTEVENIELCYYELQEISSYVKISL